MAARPLTSSFVMLKLPGCTRQRTWSAACRGHIARCMCSRARGTADVGATQHRIMSYTTGNGVSRSHAGRLVCAASSSCEAQPQPSQPALFNKYGMGETYLETLPGAVVEHGAATHNRDDGRNNDDGRHREDGPRRVLELLKERLVRDHFGRQTCRRARTDNAL